MFYYYVQICDVLQGSVWHSRVWAVWCFASLCIFLYVECWPICTVNYFIVSVTRLRFYTLFRNNTSITQNMSRHKTSGVYKTGFLMPTHEVLFSFRFINVILIPPGYSVNNTGTVSSHERKHRFCSPQSSPTDKLCQFWISYATKNIPVFKIVIQSYKVMGMRRNVRFAVWYSLS